MKVALILSTLLLTVAGLTADAHHSIAGMYDNRRDVTLDGVVHQFQFVNPHPFLVVDVLRADAAERWHLELDNRGELADIGISASTFKPGDRLVVTGQPAHREPNRLYVRQLNRPSDGFQYEQVGNEPRLRSRGR